MVSEEKLTLVEADKFNFYFLQLERKKESTNTKATLKNRYKTLIILQIDKLKRKYWINILKQGLFLVLFVYIWINYLTTKATFHQNKGL